MRLPRWLRWRTDRELDEEIQAHLDLETDLNPERGPGAGPSPASSAYRSNAVPLPDARPVVRWLYGIMASTVARRRNEIGVRMALGAGRMQIIRMAVADAGALPTPGLRRARCYRWRSSSFFTASIRTIRLRSRSAR